MKDGHTFLALELDGPLREALSGAQQALVRAGRQAGCVVEPVPRRYLQLVLDDLGPCPIEALEAIELAVDRGRGRHGPLSVDLRGLGQAALPDGRTMAWAAVSDDAGELCALRTDVHDELARYGFPLVPGAWAPHVPLLLSDVALPADALGDEPYGALPVRRLTLFRRTFDDPRGPRFRRVWRRGLGLVPPAAALQDEATARAQIGALLDARLAERTAELPRSPRKPRRRARGAQRGETP